MEPAHQQADYRTPEILPNEVQLKEVLGVGSFGKVHRAKCRGHDVALKLLHKPIVDEKNLAAFKREVAIMSAFFHPNICLFMGACTVPGNFFILQEYMPRGDVEKLLHNPDIQLSLCRRMVMAKDAALGMNWLHCNNPTFIHRDLKSSNLLIDENWKVKVCDFGLSQVKEQGKMLKDDDLAKGTPLWMAPEVMQFKEFNEKADVYSFGIVLWEFLTRKEPFQNHTNYNKFKKAVCGGERPIIPDDCEQSLKALIEDCWHPDPVKRPSFPNIIIRLDTIIIDVAVRDKLGRKFWKDNFMGKEEVTWQKFAEAFDDFLELPSDEDLSNEDFKRVNLNLKCLKAILADKPQLKAEKKGDVVQLEHFGDLLEWMGPIGDPKTTPISNTILDNIRTLLEYSWFHGDIDTNTAQERLTGKPGGTFLVRFSSSTNPGWFTVSLISTQRVILHQRIRHSPGSTYKIDNATYDSLPELVRLRNFTQPCDGSRFTKLFAPQGIQGYVGNQYIDSMNMPSFNGNVPSFNTNNATNNPNTNNNG
jgi:serine/threonine protein kinase